MQFCPMGKEILSDGMAHVNLVLVEDCSLVLLSGLGATFSDASNGQEVESGRVISTSVTFMASWYPWSSQDIPLALV